jgi:hypothetical protein
LYKLELLEADLAAKQKINVLDVAFPSGISVYTKLTNENGRTMSKYKYVSNWPGHKRYFFNYKKPGTYFLTLYAKKIDQDQYHLPVAKGKVVCSQGTNQALPPSGELIIYRRFHKQKYKLLAENVSQGGENGLYKLQVQAPPGYTMACSLRDDQKKRQRAHYLSHAQKDVYSFWFSAPGPGPYLAKIYSYAPGKKGQTVCYFKFNARQKGPILPLPGKVYFTRYWQLYGLKLIKSRLQHLAKKPALIKVKVKADAKMYCKLYNGQGKRQPKLWKIERRQNMRLCRFFPTRPGTYLAKIYVNQGSGKSRLVAVMRFKK